MNERSRLRIPIDACTYEIDLLQRVALKESAVRIIIPVFIMNDMGCEILRVCLQSLRRWTEEEVEIWIVDNNSDDRCVDWLTGFDPQTNLVLNRTEPINPARRKSGVREKLFGYSRGKQMQHASYANAIGLELGRKCIPPSSELIFTMHSDTLATKGGWLRHLKSKLTGQVRAAAFRSDPARVHALHIGGMLVDFGLFEQLQMSFLPNMRRERFPDMPEYDVGDQITLKLREHGFGLYVAPNTFNNPGLTEKISPDSPLRLLPCDRCFDDQWDVFYMHMGRGTPKAIGSYQPAEGKTYPQQWIELADTYVLNPGRGG